ncbi:aminotransferase class V-fold PLP-dependent enzyme [Megasphaera sp. AM44-1BH]|uniref:aminotransferase class V-fold PLP-dependent enzyme n=1 Tax=Megasphaera sp. AM44-1BH TaxID=2292358 RepID=UPI000E51CCD0|nr:aminotransferase class V-fold PLP-dependent enzyme [Megasphaera sp. AM44-1BH]RHA10632.1 aminotransferase class V-fold PLP-dependent enzyme [Megasphaera sp. AM44-1BH]
MYYFDNAATTVQKPQTVADAVYDVLSSGLYGNPSRGAHGYSLRAYELVLDAKEQVKGLFHTGPDYDVAFTHNSTTALNLVLKGLLRPGDHVLTTMWEHNAVLRPLYQLEKEGVAIDFIGSDAHTGQLRYEEMEQKIRPETKLLVCNHASNVTGNVLDLSCIASFCQNHGLFFVVDASQSAGVVPIDMSDGTVTAVCFTGHKSLYGPGGTGGVCIRRDAPVRPVLTGGDGVHAFDHDQPGGVPAILEAGTSNVAGIAGLRAGVAYIRDHWQQLRQKQADLNARFLQGLRSIPGLVVYGDFSRPRVPVFAVNFSGAESAVVSDILWETYGIATRPGFHCAPLLHESLGTKQQGAVRFSLSSFTTEEDLEAALVALKKISALQ